MAQTTAKRPLTTLQKNTKKSVVVRLKNDVEYKGKMANVDSYMNLIMTDAEELKDGKAVEKFGRVILRGNNVLFIKLENEFYPRRPYENDIHPRRAGPSPNVPADCFSRYFSSFQYPMKNTAGKGGRRTAVS